ncbi:hypothetical protein ACFVGY_18850 [Streptomyces sp. NPDC127106]|uniref:hypothetical protein n=1 Tax=Streptomyces sp. NPDC127106 TaxID=3345360 RepID=UPI003628789E
MRPAIAPLPSSAPAQLGGYRILGVLGSGGMGTVYLARRGRHPVALKTIRPELLRDTELRERIAREATAAETHDPFRLAVAPAVLLIGQPSAVRRGRGRLTHGRPNWYPRHPAPSPRRGSTSHVLAPTPPA